MISNQTGGILVPIKKGNFEIDIIKHSRNPAGLEAITFQWTYERMIHAEVMTHRWSRNYSSSRAIPYDKMMEWVAGDPAQSLHVGSNRAGMQAGAEIDNLSAFRIAVNDKFAEVRAWCDGLVKVFDPHKEVINRYTEPWGWITGMATMGRAQYMNFIALRCTAFANANIQRVAINSLRLFKESTPQDLEVGQWHVPYFDDYIPKGDITDGKVMHALTWSGARSAWISYNNPTKDATFAKAQRRHDDCVNLKHATPLEHQLRARGDRGKTGLVPGYDSYRMMIPGESAENVDIDAILAQYGDRDYLVPT